MTDLFEGSLREAIARHPSTSKMYVKDSETGELTLKTSIELKGLETTRFVSYLTWYGDGLLAVAHGEDCVIVKIDPENGELVELFKSSLPITWLGLLSQRVFFATTKGTFLELMDDNDSRVRFAVQPSDPYDVKASCERILVLGSSHDLFLDGQLLASSVTSYLVSDDICIYITLQHKMHLVSLTTRQQLGAERAVELGSVLIACTSETGVVMQMPRGNLETIHPRPFVIRVIKRLIDSGKYIEALRDMKKHRIDMNLLVDYKPEGFFANVSKLVREIKDPELICILVSSLTNERTVWCIGNPITDKVNRITRLVADEVLLLPDERRVEMFIVLLSALLKSSPPQVEKALRIVKKHTDELPVEKRDAYSRKWLHHVRFFVKEERLFNAALSTYDLKLALQVAEVSNRDPKEYLPLLNELRKVEPEVYRKYRIDMIRSDWEGALRHLSQLDDKWEEAVDLIRDKNLFSVALLIYLNTPRYKSICALYASVLESKAQWDEAAALYEKAEDFQKALRCLELSRNVDRYVSMARFHCLQEDVVAASLKKMAVMLKGSGNLLEAAKALEIAKASAVSIVEAYAGAGQWLKVVQTAECGKEVSLARRLLVERANVILGEITAKAEVFTKHLYRLEVVRGIKKECIAKMKKGTDPMEDLENADLYSEAESILSLASRRSGKTGVSRASTTATVRKRKQIDRKKQSLKEGGEYEDSALLLVLAAYYKWLNELIVEMVELLPSLVKVDELSLAGSLQRTVERFVNEASNERGRIWPSKLHPWHLPGPLYAVYTVNDVFTFPADGGMPEVVTLEQEIVAPVLDTTRKWQLQLLKTNEID
ncbi:hypothetical protein Q1695_010665 [Nippostrongylus brasiliensis]|nr:hypothetical protein Q1695_010665 [Nippostrongylus brasiliensis]